MNNTYATKNATKARKAAALLILSATNNATEGATANLKQSCIGGANTPSLATRMQPTHAHNIGVVSDARKQFLQQLNDLQEVLRTTKAVEMAVPPGEDKPDILCLAIRHLSDIEHLKNRDVERTVNQAVLRWQNAGVDQEHIEGLTAQLKKAAFCIRQTGIN